MRTFNFKTMNHNISMVGASKNSCPLVSIVVFRPLSTRDFPLFTFIPLRSTYDEILRAATKNCRLIASHPIRAATFVINQHPLARQKNGISTGNSYSLLAFSSLTRCR